MTARTTLVIALIHLTVGAVVAQERPTVTLDEAITRALEASPAQVGARADTRVAGAGLMEARGEWLPTLNSETTFATSSNERFDQATGRLVSESYTARLLAGYDLFTGGRRLARWQAAIEGLRAAEARERGQEFATVLEATRVFYAAAAAEELLAAAGQRRERALRQQEFADTRRLVGTATRSDVLRAELEAADAELAVIEAESELRTARLLLGRTIRHDGPVRPAPGQLPESPPALPPAAALADRAEANAPAAVAARAALDQAEAVKRETWGRYVPSLRVTGGYDWFAFDWPPDEESWSLRVTASLPLFDGLQREADLSRAEAGRRVADAEARDARLAVRLLVQDAAGEVETAGRRVEIARRALELAEEDLRVVEERYRIGAVTILDLQASQVALADAEVEWIRVRQDLGVAVAALEAELGEPLSEVIS